MSNLFLDMDGLHSLSRFVDAQDKVYGLVVSELRNGAKESHWMWFIFPQLRGLGASEASQYFGIAGMREARAYLDDALLGGRLIDCTKIVLSLRDVSLETIFGRQDCIKFVSCMTLFSMVEEAPNVFKEAIARLNAGVPDEKTIDLLSGEEI